MPNRNTNVHSHNANEPTTPRRSARLLLLQHNPINPPTPFNSKASASSKKPSNQKSSQSPSKSRNCTSGLRRSPRLNGGLVGVPSLRRSPRFSNHNDKKPNKFEICLGDSENSNSGSRKSARLKGRSQVGGAPETTKSRAITVERGVADEEKGRNENGAEAGERRKRKRKRKRKYEEIAKGWTKEQELALQRAYLAARPSPHFWKNVAKLVPGKSQQECFDRIHRDHITPPQSQPRSRAKTIMSSPLHQFSISASKLLKPFDKKVRRSNFLKRKNYITQKLLQCHLKVDRDREGDIFSLLEPNVDFSTNVEAISTPKQLKENQGLLKSFSETSSSTHKKSLSRFSNSCTADLVSPPVLKQVKNRVLHEKYINQLRCREARRTAASAQSQVPITGKTSAGSSIQKRDVVKAAKVALVSKARDAINKFQQSQTNFIDNTCSSDEDKGDAVGVEYEKL